MIFVIVALIVVALAAVALAALGFQLMQQSGRILERVETLEGIATEKILAGTNAPIEVPGLGPNSVAPVFELPDLGGKPRSLGEWRGHRTLLIFIDPSSYYCLQLMDSLRWLSRDVTTTARPTPLIVSIGDAEQTRSLFDGRGIDLPVLVHHDSEVAASYMVDALPAAYIISEDGLVAGTIVYGNQAVLVAAGEVGEGASSATGAQRLAGDEIKAQEGLKPGTQAPIFRLPRLGGGEISLLEYRGKDTLLVFSDPECEPCIELMPKLAELSKTRPELGIVVVSRGDEAANQRHFANSAASFTVGLQRNWEVSRDYGLIATPIGYLIDEWGVITSGVAFGGDAILELAK